MAEHGDCPLAGRQERGFPALVKPKALRNGFSVIAIGCPLHPHQPRGNVPAGHSTVSVRARVGGSLLATVLRASILAMGKRTLVSLFLGPYQP